MIKYSKFKNLSTPSGASKNESWQDFSAYLSKFRERPAKDGELYSPAVYLGKPYRKNSKVVAVSAIVLDFDNNNVETPTRPEDITPLLQDYNYAYHTTYSSTPDKIKWRLIVPLDQAITADKFDSVRRGLIDLIGNPKGLDTSCKDISRAYFAPSGPPGSAANFSSDFTANKKYISHAALIAQSGIDTSLRQYEGRHDRLSTYLGGMFNENLGDDECAKRLLDHDAKEHPENPLFQDASESDMQESSPLLNALRFVRSHRTSMNERRRRDGLAPITGNDNELVEEGDIYDVVLFNRMQIDTACVDFVHNVLTYGGMSVVYGDSNVGKSFFAIDLCMAVARGKKWRGNIGTDKGGVIYVAAEGGRTFTNRLMAYKKYHNIDDDEAVPFGAINSTVSFRSHDAVQKLARTVINAVKTMEVDVHLVVIDTLARAIDGGNENSSEDMGLLISLVDLIRHWTGVHCMLIHHTGKDKIRGARGHSSLRAATDTEIELDRMENAEHIIMPEVTKQRDLPAIKLPPFSLKQVVLGENERGEDVTSCVTIQDEIDHRTEALTGNAVLLNEVITAESTKHKPNMGQIKFDKTGLEMAFKYAYEDEKGKAPTQDAINKAFYALIKAQIIVELDDEYLYFTSTESKNLYVNGGRRNER